MVTSRSFRRTRLQWWILVHSIDICCCRCCEHTVHRIRIRIYIYIYIYIYLYYLWYNSLINHTTSANNVNSEFQITRYIKYNDNLNIILLNFILNIAIDAMRSSIGYEDMWNSHTFQSLINIQYADDMHHLYMTLNRWRNNWRNA